MAQPWASLLRPSRPPAEQIASLKALKNEAIGHSQKKEVLLGQGLLEPLVQLCWNTATSRQDGKAHNHTFATRPLSEEEIVRLQSLQVVASFALEGPLYLAPLQSVSAVPAVLSNLCPARNPAQLVVATLRVLSNMADSSALFSNPPTCSISTLAEALFTRQHLRSLCRIISQTSHSHYVQNQISLAATLISRVCQEERHRQSLAAHGILDALATKLASFVVAGGLVIPQADILARREGLHEYIPLAAPGTANLSVILEAISVIIANSVFRASQLLYSPSILAVFPSGQPTEHVVPHNAKAAWNSLQAAGLSMLRSQMNAVDYLLPFVPLPQMKSVSAQAFPPLGSSTSREHLSRHELSKSEASSPPWHGAQEGVPSSQDSTALEMEDPESPLIAYLVLMIKKHDGIERLMATAVLTILFNAKLTSESRTASIGLLVVPLLVRMLDDSSQWMKQDATASENTALMWSIKEKAPAVLAMLIKDSEALQKAAFDARVVTKLSKMLKVAYEPVLETLSLKAWTPREEEESAVQDQPQSCCLGGRGYVPLLVHRLKVRESVLKAVASLAPFKDEYRKSIVDHGMIPCIIESLCPFPGKPSSKVGDKSENARYLATVTIEAPRKSEGYGHNPIEVLIAACHSVRALSRSVSVLRTTLVDAGAGPPLYRLLTHADVEVQVAATGTACNMVVDFSPLREDFQNAGVVKILCSHARSANPQLRLNALWALKHFVHSVGNEVKRQCLDELGQEWLLQLIERDTEAEALLALPGTGEKQSLADLDMDEDTDMMFDEKGDPNSISAVPQTNMSKFSSGKSRALQEAEQRLAALKEDETNPVVKARRDDVAVQEQGLDFFRNLIGPPSPGSTSETTEMIDFLLHAYSQERIFKILSSKLRDKRIRPSSRNSTTDILVMSPQSEIVVSVAYILVHMSASIPRHRQLLVGQTELLELLLPFFSHPSADVRTTLCWLVNNLTWLDDDMDRSSTVQRCHKLRMMGFQAKLETLEKDPELNVKERAKGAMHQLLIE